MANESDSNKPQHPSNPHINIQRIMAGIERARANGTRSGKPIGRPARVLDREAIRQRKNDGATITQLQREFKIGRGHVQRVLAQSCKESPKTKPNDRAA